jgi:dTDP-4-dehydrorhamnose reductase
MIKLLLTGASGLLGGNILRHAACDSRINLCAVQKSNFAVPERFSLGKEIFSLDLTDETAVWNLLSQWRPNAIIHTAAMTEPNACEWQRADATRANIDATHTLVKLSEHFGARLVFISTDLVFNGEQGLYSETDSPTPLSFYGDTKVQSENDIAITLTDYAILRTSIMIGNSPRGNRAVNERLMSDVSDGKTPTLFSDEYRTPIAVDTLAQICLEFVLGAAQEATGIFHAVGSERISRYDLGRKIFGHFHVPEHCYRAALLKDFTGTPQRPRDCSLNNKKILGVVRTPIPTLDDIIAGL